MGIFKKTKKKSLVSDRLLKTEKTLQKELTDLSDKIFDIEKRFSKEQCLTVSDLESLAAYYYVEAKYQDVCGVIDDLNKLDGFDDLKMIEILTAEVNKISELKKTRNAMSQALIKMEPSYLLMKKHIEENEGDFIKDDILLDEYLENEELEKFKIDFDFIKEYLSFKAVYLCAEEAIERSEKKEKSLKSDLKTIRKEGMKKAIITIGSIFIALMIALKFYEYFHSHL
ncbi:hypothetical protein RFA60_000229 [Vibrio parahaemolyticus]|nr:hypothetical protein [Vibrio parahaemolyticus]